jgi:hypothetical protein
MKFCINPLCPNPGGDFRGIQKAHILHRKMGGRHGRMKKIIDDSRNVADLCAICHDIIDRRVKSPLRETYLEAIKDVKDWGSWVRESNLRSDTQEV